MREKGKIEKYDINIDYEQRNSREYLSSIKGLIILESGESYPFKYNELKFDIYLLKNGLHVSFDLSDDSSGNKLIENIEKAPSQYGLLHSHNEHFKNGIFRVLGYADGVMFNDYHIRNGDAPFYNSIYTFDIVDNEKNIYSNSHYPAVAAESSINFDVGQVKNGIVRNIQDYGAFIDIEHPHRDALLPANEIIWSREKVVPFNELSEGDDIEVLITDIRTKNDKIEITVSAKALLPLPDIRCRAMNIFRVNQMNPRIIGEIVGDIVQRDDILPEIKIGAIHIIKSHPELYQDHKSSTIPLLYEHCKKEFLKHLDNKEYHKAFPLFQEYATYDNQILNDLDRFPDYFLEELNSNTISIEMK